MRQLSDLGQKIRAERQVSSFIGGGLDPELPFANGCYWAIQSGTRWLAHTHFEFPVFLIRKFNAEVSDTALSQIVRWATELYIFSLKVVRINALQFIIAYGRHSDVVVNHEFGKLFTGDEDNFRGNNSSIFFRFF